MQINVGSGPSFLFEVLTDRLTDKRPLEGQVFLRQSLVPSKC